MLSALLICMFITGLWSLWYANSLGGFGFNTAGVVAVLFLIIPTVVGIVHLVS